MDCILHASKNAIAMIFGISTRRNVASTPLILSPARSVHFLNGRTKFWNRNTTPIKTTHPKNLGYIQKNKKPWCTSRDLRIQHLSYRWFTFFNQMIQLLQAGDSLSPSKGLLFDRMINFSANILLFFQPEDLLFLIFHSKGLWIKIIIKWFRRS